jgi:transposase
MVLVWFPAMEDWDRLLEEWHLESGFTGLADEETWVTLAEAEARVGVSRSALRSWYRTGQVPSRLVDGPHGPQHLVPLDAVIERAEHSPRLQRKAARAVGVEAELALLRDRVADLERRLAAVERRFPGTGSIGGP